MLQPGRILATVVLAIAALLSASTPASAHADSPSARDLGSGDRRVVYVMSDSTWG
ncbi:hypothetical protein ACWC5I_17455 [Kitasatospora sp. NPDC001574]